MNPKVIALLLVLSAVSTGTFLATRAYERDHLTSTGIVSAGS